MILSSFILLISSISAPYQHCLFDISSPVTWELIWLFGFYTFSFWQYNLASLETTGSFPDGYLFCLNIFVFRMALIFVLWCIFILIRCVCLSYMAESPWHNYVLQL